MEDRKIKLELSWNASLTYGTAWELSTVDIKIKESNWNIWANLNKKTSENQEMKQTFTIQKKINPSNDIVRNYLLNPEKKCDLLQIPSHLATAMSISVRIFKSVEDRSVMYTKPQGGFYFKTKSIRDDLPVHIEKMPEFEDGATYILKITSAEEEGNKGSINKVWKAFFEKRL